MKLYSLYRTKAFKGVNGAAIANCFSRNGLNVHLAHSSSQMMDNRGGYFTDELYAALLAEYRTEAEKYDGKIDISTDVRITCDILRQELDRDMTRAKEPFTSYSDHGETGFLCIDPLMALIAAIKDDNVALEAPGILPLKAALLDKEV